MSSSPVDRMSGASTPTLLAMSSYSTNRLHEELSGLKRWRQMYDSAMNEKNEEVQKLQLINQRQAQTLNDSIVQIEQQTMTIHSMKQNEILLEKKVAKLEELHHILKKNVTKLEKTVSQCEFVRVDLERLYEHQERNVKSLADRVDSTIETKLQNLQSQLKLVEQLHDQARNELQKQIHENNQTQTHVQELTIKLTTSETEMNELRLINTNLQSKIHDLSAEINKSHQTIESLTNDNQFKLQSKNDEIDHLQKRIDCLVLKIDANKEEIFSLTQHIDEVKETSNETHRTEINLRSKENEQLQNENHRLTDQIKYSTNEIDELKMKNGLLQNEMEQLNSHVQKQIDQTRDKLADYAKQSIEYEHRFEEQTATLSEKDKVFNDLKIKHDELVEKMELSDEEINQLTKENEDLRTQYHLLIQETDEKAEQIKQKDVIVEATNIEIGEKEKEIDDLKVKVTSLEERLSKNQNLLTSLRSSMGEKDAKIKRLEQGTPSPRPTTIRRAGPTTHPLATQTKSSIPPTMVSKINPREKRMLPPPATNDLTSTPKKIFRLSQTKAAIDQAHALEKSVSPVADDDRDEVASNTSVASLFEYLKKI